MGVAVTDTSPAAVERPAYLIRKHGGYYKPNSQGYTGSAILAGRYTLAEAESITHPNGLDGPRDGMTYLHEGALKDDDWLAYAALSAQVAAANARAAAAYEAAAKIGDKLAAQNGPLAERGMNKDYQAGLSSGGQAVASAIRALTPAHAAAALDRIKAEARAEALREAAEIADENLDRVQPHVVDGVMEDETAQGYGNAAINIAHSILALLDTPAPAQPSVQEAARVLLDQPYGVMSGAFDAMEKLHGEGADRIMAAALRAIAGGGDE